MPECMCVHLRALTSTEKGDLSMHALLCFVCKRGFGTSVYIALQAYAGTDKRESGASSDLLVRPWLQWA